MRGLAAEEEGCCLVTRSFDRRTQDVYDRFFRARLNIEKEEPVSLDLDCMCEKNDPNCATCWVPVAIPTIQEQFALSQFDRDVRYRFDECLELLLRKHKDYGPANIANAPGGPLNGLRVRLHDKMARVNHLIDSGAAPSNESLRDSFRDGANYFVIGLMVLDGVWPGTEHT